MRAVTPHRAGITASGRPGTGLAGHAIGLARVWPVTQSALAIPAICGHRQARRKERLDTEGMVNSAGLSRIGGNCGSERGDGRRCAVPGRGPPWQQAGMRQPLSGNEERIIQYAEAKSGCAGPCRARGADGCRYSPRRPTAAGSPRCRPRSPRATMAGGVPASGHARSGPPATPSRRPPGPCRSRPRPGPRG